MPLPFLALRGKEGVERDAFSSDRPRSLFRGGDGEGVETVGGGRGAAGVVMEDVRTGIEDRGTFVGVADTLVVLERAMVFARAAKFLCCSCCSQRLGIDRVGCGTDDRFPGPPPSARTACDAGSVMKFLSFDLALCVEAAEDVADGFKAWGRSMFEDEKAERRLDDEAAFISGRGRLEVEDEATGWSSFINLEGFRQSDFMRRGGIGGGRTLASAVLVDICCSRLSVVGDGVTNRCGGCG